MRPWENSPGPVYGGGGDLEEAADGEVAVGARLPGGDIGCIL
jgi:hypothetical protein